MNLYRVEAKCIAVYNQSGIVRCKPSECACDSVVIVAVSITGTCGRLYSIKLLLFSKMIVSECY